MMSFLPSSFFGKNYDYPYCCCCSMKKKKPGVFPLLFPLVFVQFASFCGILAYVPEIQTTFWAKLHCDSRSLSHAEAEACRDAAGTSAIVMSVCNLISTSIVSAIAAPILGRFGDKNGRRPCLMLCFLLLAFEPATLCANVTLNTSLLFYYASTMLSGFSLLQTVLSAYVCDIVVDDNAQRKQLLTAQAIILQLSLIVGPQLMKAVNNRKVTLEIAAMTPFIVAILTLFFVPESCPPPNSMIASDDMNNNNNNDDDDSDEESSSVTSSSPLLAPPPPPPQPTGVASSSSSSSSSSPAQAILSDASLRNLLFAACAFSASMMTMTSVNALFFETYLGFNAADLANIISLVGWCSAFILVILICVPAFQRRLSSRAMVSVGLASTAVAAALIATAGMYHDKRSARKFVYAATVLQALGTAVAPVGVTSLLGASAARSTSFGQGSLQGTFQGLASVPNGIIPFLFTLWFKHVSGDTSSTSTTSASSLYVGLSIVAALGCAISLKI